MNNACVIGWGTVGKATGAAFGIDKYYSRSNYNITLQEAAKCKYVFICLPTPTVNGQNFIRDIYDTLKILHAFDTENTIYIIRSTVYPGFSRFIQSELGIKRIVSNPEFLSEATAVMDAKNPDLIVIGADDMDALLSVKALYEGRFKYKEIVSTDSVTAELIKYTLNTFFATKVIFANEIYNFARHVNANYETIRKVLEKHPWGSKNHFKVWYKDQRGIHGKCLPKDTEAFANITDSKFFKILLELNERIKYEQLQ
jgi:UDPglucose 6-dehydrogenase